MINKIVYSNEDPDSVLFELKTYFKRFHGGEKNLDKCRTMKKVDLKFRMIQFKAVLKVIQAI